LAEEISQFVLEKSSRRRDMQIKCANCQRGDISMQDQGEFLITIGQ
jgi:ssDNA-binding Zn-finger/Zn-ribbon topoisomerase 1